MFKMEEKLQVFFLVFLKSYLLMINAFVLVSGIIILAIGIWVEVELYKYMEMSTAFNRTAPYVFIVTGLLIILVGSFACCCTVKGQPILLYIYGVFLAVIFILELGAGISIFTYRAKLTDGFDKGLTQAMQNYLNDSAHLAQDFDLMQETLHCCGNHQPRDWLDLPHPQPIPQSCCIQDNCTTEKEDQIYSQGCYTKIIEFLNGNVGIVAGAAVGIAFFPLIGVILSCCLAKVINKAKYEQMA
ncbi:tetraspanin-6-like isoform X2 [Diabrotica virgifera virgifera]|uniref:Tetraspanin n=1 Tax=Diabrotica virgifera virgifera TaxID=50390 RepID=A0A6P7FYY4_DIAVI|nr:tetraspanin-6-like isoform X2 [Diabrotica virgifera virgifera]